MKINIPREELLRSIGRVQGIIERRGTLPILTNALIDAKPDVLQIAATDLEVGVVIRQPADVVEPGTVTLGAKKLYEIVRELEHGGVTLETEEDSRVSIACGDAAFSLLSISPEEYPTLPEAEGVRFIEVESSLLGELIDSTLYATSTDETRYNLNGVYIEIDEAERLCFVATDGHRLSLARKSTSSALGFLEVGQRGIIVPRKGVSEIRKLCDETDGSIEIGLGDGFVLTRREGLLLSCRLIDGDFPAYRQVLPQNQKIRVVIDREKLLHAVRRVALVASDRSGGVSLAIEDHQLRLTASNPGVGEARESVAVEYAGDRYETRFDARYLAEAVAAMISKEVVLELIDELSPALIRPVDDPDLQSVIMPMRL